MEAFEKNQLQKDLAKLNLGEKEILQMENEDLKEKLLKVTREFNEYKTLIQTKVLPRYDNFHRVLREAEWDLKKKNATNDALWNFISKNGLGQKCYDEVFEDLPSFQSVDLSTINDSVYSQFDKGQALEGLLYQVQKYSKN